MVAGKLVALLAGTGDRLEAQLASWAEEVAESGDVGERSELEQRCTWVVAEASEKAFQARVARQFAAQHCFRAAATPDSSVVVPAGTMWGLGFQCDWAVATSRVVLLCQPVRMAGIAARRVDIVGRLTPGASRLALPLQLAVEPACTADTVVVLAVGKADIVVVLAVELACRVGTAAALAAGMVGTVAVLVAESAQLERTVVVLAVALA